MHNNTHCRVGRRSPRVFVQGPGDGGADHVPAARTADARPGVRRLPGVRQDEEGTGKKVRGPNIDSSRHATRVAVNFSGEMREE